MYDVRNQLLDGQLFSPADGRMKLEIFGNFGNREATFTRFDGILMLM